jgi:hypothetical protein
MEGRCEIAGHERVGHFLTATKMEGYHDESATLPTSPTRDVTFRRQMMYLFWHLSLREAFQIETEQERSKFGVNRCYWFGYALICAPIDYSRQDASVMHEGAKLS